VRRRRSSGTCWRVAKEKECRAGILVLRWNHLFPLRWNLSVRTESVDLIDQVSEEDLLLFGVSEAARNLWLSVFSMLTVAENDCECNSKNGILAVASNLEHACHSHSIDLRQQEVAKACHTAVTGEEAQG
jgi:hypothetical protein